MGSSKSYAPVSQCSADHVAASMFVSRFRRRNVQKAKREFCFLRSAGPSLLARGEAVLEGRKEQAAPGMWLLGAGSSTCVCDGLVTAVA